MMDPYLATAISRARSGSYPDICDAELILAELDKVSAERDAWAKHLPVEIVEQGLEITRCHHRIAVLEAALSYYAKEHKNPSEGPWGLNSTDFGEVARRALEASK